MKKITFLAFIALLSSCFTEKKIPKENIDLLKQLTYCRCIEYSMKEFDGLNSSDRSYGDIVEEMDSKGLYNKNINHLIDSIVGAELFLQKKIRIDSAGKHNDNGRFNTTYILRCLQLYKSKTIDSFYKSLPKSLYYVQYSDLK